MTFRNGFRYSFRITLISITITTCAYASIILLNPEMYKQFSEIMIEYLKISIINKKGTISASEQLDIEYMYTPYNAIFNCFVNVLFFSTIFSLISAAIFKSKIKE